MGVGIKTESSLFCEDSVFIPNALFFDDRTSALCYNIFVYILDGRMPGKATDMKHNPRKLLRKLNYLPRWAWYLCSFFIAGPFGVLGVYLVFHVLEKAAQDIEDNFFDLDDTFRAADASATDREIEQRWQQTEASARSVAQREATQQPIDENAQLSDVIAQGRSAMRSIRHANDLIPDPQLSAQIDSIENSCGQILSILEQRPQLLPQLRTFLRYYLPTTLRLLDARAKLESTANTPKAREVRERISQAVGVIDKAFLKQVESLDEYRFIDLESEMDVLRDMMRADGLIDEQEEADDPFAEVLTQKYGTVMGGH